MSHLSDLIEELCPEGVSYVKVGDYFQRISGTPITAGKMKEIACDDGEIKIFAGGKTVVNAHETDIPKANITRVPAVLVQSRGVIDVVYYDEPFTFKNEMWAYTCEEQTTVKFLYYVLKNNAYKFAEEASGMGSLPQISLRVTGNFQIPLPPLPVQREIVKILDNFTELTAELTAELELRKKQYAYYREHLLSVENLQKMSGVKDVLMLPLEEVFVIKNGYTPSKANKDFWTDGTIPWFRMDDIRANGRILKDSLQHITPQAVKGKLFPANSIILATTATIGEHALIIVDSLANQQFSFFTKRELLDFELDMKFAFYYFFIIDEWCQHNTKVSSFLR